MKGSALPNFLIIKAKNKTPFLFLTFPLCKEQLCIVLYYLVYYVFSEEVGSEVPLLGRGGRNKSRENPGIAKKGGGGSDPCQDWFGGFDIVT